MRFRLHYVRVITYDVTNVLMLLFLLNRLHYAFEKFIYFCYQQKKNCFYYLYYQVDLKVHLYNLLPPPLSTTIFIQMQAQILSASQLGNGQKHRSTHSLLHKVGPRGHHQHSSDIICLSARQWVLHPKTQTLTHPPPPKKKKKLPLSLGSNPIFINFVKN